MRSFLQFVHTTQDTFRIYWKIAPFLTLTTLVTQIILSFQGIANAYVFGLALDRLLLIFSKKILDIADALPIILLFVSINFLATVVGILHSFFSSALMNLDTGRLRLLQTDYLANLGISQLEDPELTNKSTRFSETYPSFNQHLSLLVGLIAMTVSVLTYGVVVFSFAPLLMLVFIALFFVKYFNNGRFIKRLWLIGRNSTEERRIAWGSISFVGEPSSLKELLISGGVKFLRNKFLTYINWVFNEHKKIRKKWLFFEIGHSFFDTILYGIGIYFLIQKGLVESITIGTITFYLRSLGSFADQLDTLSYRVARAFESSIRLQDALELFEFYKPEADGNKSLIVSETPPVIKLENISFKYPTGKYPVINNLSLVLNSGEKIAIVGENGAGKTTLVKLLTRIYRPQEGAIVIDKYNLNELNHKSWYSKLGVLFQDFNSYGQLSVEENVRIGKILRKYSQEDVIVSLTKADALGFVDRYPKKLDQILSERYKGGIRPSGGQWQKIAIARFFYRNAPILILDEPTASIDAVSEANIFDNIYKFMKGKTVIIISHRFSTVRNADRILVLDKGRIIEEGSHEELLKMKGKYAKAFKLQARGYE